MPDPETDFETFARLAEPGDVVAIVGAGGKTTTMFALADALAARGLTVVTTKSTIIHRPTMARSPYVVEIPELRWAAELPDLLRARSVVTLITAAPSERRWDGVAPELVAALQIASGADVVIVEADGARQRLLKAPAAHEPAMPPTASVVMPVASLRALGQPLAERHMHRPELVARLLGVEPGTPLTPEQLATLLTSEFGGLKAAPPGARVWPVLTGIDSVETSVYERVTARLARHPRVTGWVVATGPKGDWHYAAARQSGSQA